METDPRKVKRMAAKREDEMEAFCLSLKDCGVSSRNLDAMLRKSLRQVIPQLDCTKCASCCKEAYVVVDTDDIARMAQALGMKRSEFRAEYIGKNEEGDTVFNRRPCPFLRRNLCTQYDSRPECCRQYPQSLAVDCTEKLENLSANYLVCPAVFHALEQLRESLPAVTTRREQKSNRKKTGKP